MGWSRMPFLPPCANSKLAYASSGIVVHSTLLSSVTESLGWARDRQTLSREEGQEGGSGR